MTSVLRPEYSYIPRSQFVGLHNRAQRWALVLAHRRAGKTVGLVNDLILGALEERLPNPQVAYIAPTFAQAKRIAWEYVKHYARPLLRDKPNETELRVDLVNGARVFLAGADNPDALRGIYLDAAVLDEYAQFRPSVYTQIIRPALADRLGWAVLSGTPRGKNHLYDAYVAARARPDRWFTLVLKASETGIIPEEELSDMRRSMDEDEYQQEMEVSFDATSRGMILQRWIEDAERAGRIVAADLYDPNGSEVIVSSDIGFSDTAAFWFWQVRRDGYALIDYMAASGIDAEGWIERLRAAKYPPSVLYLPHDAKARTFSTRHSTLEQFVRSGMQTRVVPRSLRSDRINAARTVLPFCWFDSARCAEGLAALREWSYTWDADNKVFSKEPLHNHASDPADAFTYGAQALAYHADAWSKKRREAHQQVDEDGLPVLPSASYAFTLEQLHEDHQRMRGRSWI